MLIIPAVDIKNGKCVRLEGGDYSKVDVYSDSPAEMAKKWLKEGANALHVIDLDGAMHGETRNFNIVRQILEISKVPVQVGGGIRTEEAATKILDLGAKVILGTSLVENEKLVVKLLKRYGKEKIIAAVDSKNGKLALEGWLRTIDISPYDFAKKVESLGICTILFTAVERDGSLLGPDFKAVEKMISSTGMNVIASGGISSLEDIRKLKEMRAYAAVIGKALYRGKISLKEALKC